MAKSGMSAGFSKFASKTTKGSYDEARKGERFGRGVPFPIGTKGTAVVSAIICDETKADPKTGEQFTRVSVELSVEVPESHRGKPLRAGYFVMQDSKKPGSTWTAEDCWGSMLGALEDLGLPETISKEYSDFQECLDWFEEAPRHVNFEVQANNYKNKSGVLVEGKQVTAFAVVDEGSIPSADAPAEEIDPDATYCIYKGTKHRVLDDANGSVTIKSVNSGNTRTVKKEAVEIVS